MRRIKLSKSQDHFYGGLSFDSSWPFLYIDWCITFSLHRKDDKKTSSNWIVFKNILSHGNQFWDHNKRTHYCGLISRMVSFFLKWVTSCDCMYWSQQSFIFHVCSYIKLSAMLLEQAIILLWLCHHIWAWIIIRIIRCFVAKILYCVQKNNNI